MSSTNASGLPPRPPVGVTDSLSLPPPPPPSELPPLPKGTPQVYRFQGSSYRPSDHAQGPAQQTEFSFRSDHSAPRFPGGPLPSAPTGPRSERNRRDRERRPQRYGGRRFVAPSDRPLLQSQRESTPEQLTGMGEDHQSRFMIPDDVSDSDEEDMELESHSSDDDHGSDNISATHDTPAAEEGPPRKKQAVESGESNVPKWSNPDPYTALPPPDETHKKRKDVVKLIRKARVGTKATDASTNSMATNDDFISLDFGDEEKSDESDAVVEDSAVRAGSSQRSSGPRFSHLDNLHPDRNLGPPGANGATVTSSTLGPPPSKTSNDSRYSGLGGSDLDVWPPPDVESALGSRKRTFDDRILSDQAAAGPRKRKTIASQINGAISAEWRPKAGLNPTPWCTVDHCITDNMGLWLHKEICDFYEYARPRDFESIVRNEMLQRLQQAVKLKWNDAELHCFGSFAGGLYLPNADMDVVVVSRSFITGHRKVLCQNRKQLFQFSSFLESQGIPAPGSVVVIAGARVPLVKFTDKITGLKVDMSFENDAGLIANHTFADWKARFPAMPIIVSMIKQFLAMRNLHDVAFGGLGGFSVTCLVTSMLQLMPEVQTGNFIPELNLGMVLMRFLDLYGNEFNTSTTAITLDPPGYVDKVSMRNLPYNANKAERLCLVDPNNRNNDISGGSKNILLILKCFSEAYDKIQKRLVELKQMDDKARQGQSILGCILAGDYSSFEWHRQRLWDLYRSSGRA